MLDVAAFFIGKIKSNQFAVAILIHYSIKFAIPGSDPEPIPLISHDSKSAIYQHFFPFPRSIIVGIAVALRNLWYNRDGKKALMKPLELA